MMGDWCKLSSNIDVLILGRFGQGNGNNTTANRIRKYLLEHGWTCELKESNDFMDISALNQFIVHHKVGCALGIHAFRSGKLLRGVSIPYCIIFGGTDINEYCQQDQFCKLATTEAVSRASILVAFSQCMADKAASLLPVVTKKKLQLIPQGVLTEPAFCSDRAAWLIKHGLPADSCLFTLVAGLRPVKDPLFLVQPFSEWHQMKLPNAHLVIVGPQMDLEFSTNFLKAVAGQPGIIYVGSLSIQDTHRLIASSFALVNSSVSEGMSTAILEAMDLGVPVIARNNPGNASLVDDMHTGLLYSEPQEFIDKCELLMNSPDLRETLTMSASKQVQQFHSSQREKQQYVGLVSELMQQQ